MQRSDCQSRSWQRKETVIDYKGPDLAFLMELPSPLQSSLPHCRACCPFAGWFRCLRNAERSLVLVQGWQRVSGVACRLSVTTMLGQLQLQEPAEVVLIIQKRTAAVSLHICLLTPQPKGNQEGSEGDFVSTMLPSSAASVSPFGTFFNIMEHRERDNRYF